MQEGQDNTVEKVRAGLRVGALVDERNVNVEPGRALLLHLAGRGHHEQLQSGPVRQALARHLTQQPDSICGYTPAPERSHRALSWDTLHSHVLLFFKHKSVRSAGLVAHAALYIRGCLPFVKRAQLATLGVDCWDCAVTLVAPFVLTGCMHLHSPNS